MCRRLLFAVVFCLYMPTVSSLQCYAGVDQQCLLAPDMNDCGSDATCQCMKFRFQCTETNQACNAQEQANKVTKTGYTIIASTTCQALESLSGVFEEVLCCSTNGCNRPDNGKCLESQSRRRALRRLTDLFDFEK